MGIRSGEGSYLYECVLGGRGCRRSLAVALYDICHKRCSHEGRLECLRFEVLGLVEMCF